MTIILCEMKNGRNPIKVSAIFELLDLSKIDVVFLEKRSE